MGELILIAAMDLGGGIGIDNTLPWHIPEDLKRFKSLTTGKPILMGRKTYESLGRALPGRRNIVITRDREWLCPDAEVVYSVGEAVALVVNETAYVIGGADIYRQTLPIADKLLLTLVYTEATCDAFFPKIERTDWVMTSEDLQYSESSKLCFCYITYEDRRKEDQSLHRRKVRRALWEGVLKGLALEPLRNAIAKYLKKG